MKKYLFMIITVFTGPAFTFPAGAQESAISGQAVGWAVAGRTDSWSGQAGLRYIPELSCSAPLGEKLDFDAELSLNAFGSGSYWSADSTVWDGRIKPYRAWIKISGDRYELRAGLQKINFGSAAMLRPLMWFDRIDPRDPLQLTDGVCALLGRFYFLNNANVWIWALYGNGSQKGWETIPSVKTQPELGGRIQVPVARGELATTFHYRLADAGKVYSIPPGEQRQIREKRLALDGKFDLGPGVWFEAVLIHQEIHLPERTWQRMFNAGMDYTFGLGNGLNVTTETVTFGSSGSPLTGGEYIVFSALSCNYSLSIFSSLSGILFYDWKNNNIYNFINWSLSFDRWSFYVMGFMNPSQFDIYNSMEGANLYGGKGLQLMVVYNH